MEVNPFVLLEPVGPTEGVPRRFAFDAGAVQPPYRLVLCDEAYAVVAVAEDLGPTSFQPDPELTAQLGAHGTVHWYVEGERFDSQGRPQRVRSPFETCQIR